MLPRPHHCATEAGVEHLLILADPGGFVRQSARAQSAGANAPDLLRLYKPGILEQPHMLLHPRERHGERLGELGDRRPPATQPLEDSAPSGVGDGGEGAIEVS